MIRLNKIKIVGFKDPSEVKELEFSKEPISVIYGENGSGKTTLLKILFAVLSRDEKILLHENVSEVELDYKKDSEFKVLKITMNKKRKIIWSDDFEYSSILFGIHRGVIMDDQTTKDTSVIRYNQLHLGLQSSFQPSSNNVIQVQEKTYLEGISNRTHLSADFIKISEIQSAIVEQFNKGQGIVSDKIKRAFFETIENAVDIDETGQEFTLPSDFDQRIKAKKDFILKAIPKENSSLTERIKSYLETGNKDLTDKSKIFRAMLLNIIRSAEEPNPTLESITQLIQIFNEHLYRNKKLVVDTEKAYIDLGNDKFHSLSELSSGERNLLSLLTLFLIIGNERNFLMIDEPEISLNIKWQRDFLPLLSRLNSKAQIIVASHSPSIANRNSNYLVELK